MDGQHQHIEEPCPVCELEAAGPCPACNGHGVVAYVHRHAAGTDARVAA